MADNRIKVLIDVVKDNASKNLASLKSDFANADGAAQKFKVATGGALDFVKANAVAFAAGAGAALGTFAVKSVAAFQETALEAGKFADATGLATEDASRWIEVAGDMGISGDAVQGAFQKMNKAIADGKLDEFSAQIVKAKDGTVDANASFVNIATTIGKIKDPTERAAAAQKAFGKSYGEIARIMEMNATDLSVALASVSDAKVIDSDEIRKAKEFQAALDELKDKGEDLALSLGETLVPALVRLADLAVDAGEAAGDVLGPIKDLVDEDSLLGRAFGHGNDEIFDRAIALNKSRKEVEKMQAAAWALSASEAASGFEARLAATSINALGKEADKTTLEFAELKSGVDILNGALSKDDAKVAFIEAQEEMRAAAAAAWGGTAEDQERYVDATRRSIKATSDYIDSLGGIPANKATVIAALIDEGAYAEAQRRLEILARNISVSVGIQARGGAGYDGGISGRRASGGPVSAGNAYLVGEQGPEVMVAGANGMVVPNRALGGGGGFVVNISAMDASSFSPAFIQRLANELERAQRLQGRTWARQAG